MGFLNADIGKEELCQGTAESHILHNVTTEQWSVIDFATTKNIVISSTLFPHKGTCKHSWGLARWSDN